VNIVAVAAFTYICVKIRYFTEMQPLSSSINSTVFVSRWQCWWEYSTCVWPDLLSEWRRYTNNCRQYSSSQLPARLQGIYWLLSL